MPPVLRTVPSPAFSQLLTVFLDNPVRRTISLIDNPSRNLKRRILPSMSMVIISFCSA